MKFNKFFKGQLKRIAQNVYPSIEKRNRLQNRIDELKAEIDALDRFIAANEVTIKEATGYSVVDLIEREVVDTGKVDKKGKPIKQTKYNLKYPETIVPPVEIEHDGEHHLLDEEGEELPNLIEEIIDPTESKDFNFDDNHPNMI